MSLCSFQLWASSMFRDSWSIRTEGALASSGLDTAGGVTEDKLVQLSSSDLPQCRDRSEDAAWGSDWCTVHLLQTHDVIVGLLGVDLVGDGDGKLLGGGSSQLVHVVVWSGD